MLTSDQIENILDFIKPQKGIPEKTGISIMNKQKKLLREQLKKLKYDIHPDDLSEFKSEIMKYHFSSLITPGESVGMITAQSFGEANTQNTLNSIDWSEQILYIEGKNAVVKPIGQMIDTILEQFPSRIKYIPENRTEYLELEDGYFIPSCDEHGMCNWYKIESITRHLPVGELVKVTTQSGRQVMATQSKSFLVWNGEMFISTLGSDIKIGDILPTTRRLSPPPQQQFYFDSYLDLKETDGGIQYNRMLLDNDFGFFIGLYLANGSTTKTCVCISNNDKDVRKRIIDYCDHCDTNGIDYHNVQDDIIQIHSELIAYNLKITCDTNVNKRVPSFAYTAPDGFITGLLDGYFSGNGTFNKKDGSIIISSASKNLINGISFLLSYLNVFGVMRDSYTLHISNEYAKLFGKQIKLTSSKKQHCLQVITLQKQDKIFQKNFPNRDVYFDKVVSVEYVKGTTEYVYDLTVEVTRNFQLWNGLCQRDTFHKAGDTDKTVVMGVARFEELLSVTKSPKACCCYVYFTGGNKSVQELRKTIGSSIVELTIEKMIISIEEVLDKQDEEWYDFFKILYNSDFCNHEHCISLKMDMNILYEYSLTLEEISTIIHEKYDDLYCVFSPDSIGQIDVFVDTTSIDLQTDVVYVTKENKEFVYLFEIVKPAIKELQICGIEGIKQIYYLRDKTKPGEWMVETDGSNLPMLMCHDMVDKTRTVSNNPIDMFNTLGIDAANKTIYHELLTLMPSINNCHAKLLCDKMTYTGLITSINRYAMRKDESGPLGKASFEETLDNFVNAAIFGEHETTKGVSASIICGKRAKMGTGLCNLHVDVNVLLKMEDTSSLINGLKNLKI